ncbi:hypothetical protein ACH5RR_013046 [Cinchona calisaya]|uniref:TSL-kinase interacting protein 1 n=1 Tax=Cinchona calisaya TaxID=153742 RepID=A0ABD3A081_9GENT
MKSSGPRKRKVKDNTGAALENSANRNCKRRQKPAGGETAKGVNQSNTETAKVQNFKAQTGETLTSSKIKLQLFPINSTTQLKLEKDGHNPFLELTLSARKKVSSIIRHLNTKWDCSSAELGELMFFPYGVRLENISSCRRWTSDCGGFTAGELYGVLESPAVFRLKYGWFSNLHAEASGVCCTPTALEGRLESKSIWRDCNVFSRMTCDQIKKINSSSQGIRKQINMHEAEDIARTEQMPSPLTIDHVGDDIPAQSIVSWDDSLTSLSIGSLLSEASLLNMINNPIQKSESKSSLQPIELVSDISIGALLSEASLLDKINEPEQRAYNNSLYLRPTQPVSDSCTRNVLSRVSSECKIDSHDLKAESEPGFLPIYSASEISIGGLLSEASLQGKINAFDGTSSWQGLKPNVEKGAPESLFPWDDSLTSLSIGGLLSEASLQGRCNGRDPKSKETRSSLHSKLPTFNSAQAFVAAQLNVHTPASKAPLPDSFSSILDAEETCHAFSFKTFTLSSNESMTSDGSGKSGGCCKDSKSRTSTLLCTNENDSKAPFDFGLPTSLEVTTGGDSVSLGEFVR